MWGALTVVYEIISLSNHLGTSTERIPVPAAKFLELLHLVSTKRTVEDWRFLCLRVVHLETLFVGLRFLTLGCLNTFRRV